jgi:YD repeat-containing protein
VTVYTPVSALVSQLQHRAAQAKALDWGRVRCQSAVAYTYDNANRPLQMTQGSANVTFSYDAGGRRLSLTLPNGATTNYAYDSASEVTGITYQSSTSTLGDLNYTYDTARRRSSIGGSFARTGLPQAVSSASSYPMGRKPDWL